MHSRERPATTNRSHWVFGPPPLDHILADLDPIEAGSGGDTDILAFRVQFAY